MFSQRMAEPDRFPGCSIIDAMKISVDRSSCNGDNERAPPSPDSGRRKYENTLKQHIAVSALMIIGATLPAQAAAQSLVTIH
jgi:hypothetical protein